MASGKLPRAWALEGGDNWVLHLTRDLIRMKKAETAPALQGWRHALLHALPLAAAVLLLFYYWFGVADRYRIFLYFHDMGPLVPDTSPFSPVTSSRYWMAGLVAGGGVMILYALVIWLAARLRPGYRPPAWRHVCGAMLLPLLVGIPALTMTLNDPVLPPGYAAQVTGAAIVAMALAVWPAQVAAKGLPALFLLFADGASVAAVMFLVSIVERVGGLLQRGIQWPVVAIGVGLAGAFTLSLALTLFYWRRRVAGPPAWALFAAALCVAYLFLPLVHHIGFTDGYYYITDMDNYFTRNWILQLAAWLLGFAIAAGITQLRGRLVVRTQHDRST